MDRIPGILATITLLVFIIAMAIVYHKSWSEKCKPE